MYVDTALIQTHKNYTYAQTCFNMSDLYLMWGYMKALDFLKLNQLYFFPRNKFA